MKKYFMKKNLCEIINKINCTTRENKFFIYLDTNNIINECKKRNDLFNLSNFYSQFYKLKNKSVFNPININDIPDNILTVNFDILNDYPTMLEKHCQNIFKILEDKNIIVKNKKEYFIEFSSNLCDNLEKDNLLLKSKWPINIINYHQKLLNKKSSINIKFNIVNETELERKTEEIEIPLENPEMLFGVTFLKIRNDHHLFKSILINIIKEKLIQIKDYSILPSKIFAINPINQEKIPILVSNTLDKEIMASIPGHNEFDFDLGKRFGLQIKYILKPISEMGSSVFGKTENSTNLSLNTIKQNLINQKECPLIINQSEGAFLINSKEFDFLYLDEANELITNNLIKKGKARRTISYGMNKWIIANENETDKNIKIFQKSFIDSIKYLLILKADVANFKKLMPIDLMLADIYNQATLENIFYSRIIHKIFLENIYKDMLPIEDHNSEDVYINKEQELEKDVLFVAPFLNVLKPHLDSFPLDWENVKGICKMVDIIHASLIDTLDSAKEFRFDIEKIRDQKFILNKTNSNLIVQIYKEILVILEGIGTYEIEIINKSIKGLSRIINLLLKNISLFKENVNLFAYIYLNILLILYPLDPSAATLYSEFKKAIDKDLSQSTMLKERLDEYSLDKLYETTKFFIEMLNNSIRLGVKVNEILLGYLILDKSLLDDKKLVLSQIEDTFRLRLEKEILNYDILDEELSIKLKVL